MSANYAHAEYPLDNNTSHSNRSFIHGRLPTTMDVDKGKWKLGLTERERKVDEMVRCKQWKERHVPMWYETLSLQSRVLSSPSLYAPTSSFLFSHLIKASPNRMDWTHSNLQGLISFPWGTAERMWFISFLYSALGLCSPHFPRPERRRTLFVALARTGFPSPSFRNHRFQYWFKKLLALGVQMK